MTAEKVENNGDKASEAEQANNSSKTTSTRAKKDKEVLALSVKEKADKESQGINLFKHGEGLPENRPIGVSHLAIKEGDGLPGSRPVEASHLKVVSTFSLWEPIALLFQAVVEISSTLAISGNRPCRQSSAISDTIVVMAIV
ncbi:MAG: hypothetical protein HC820_09705, partial [Hydrococcus sp. RM1_1_31]|nr:hypothetical protein [Hydrococcus sp. RM1_1_31]